MLNAVEVLEWLKNHYKDGTYTEVFGGEFTIVRLLEKFTTQEIVYRIEKYEAKKYNLSLYTDEEIKILDEISKDIEHLEPPKEEKQKIHYAEYEYDENGRDLTVENIMRVVNQLVDAVNELRGATE